MGDVNGDGVDIVAFSSLSGSAHSLCKWFIFDPVNNQSVITNILDATIVDLNADGSAEIISISMSGSLAYQS